MASRQEEKERRRQQRLAHEQAERAAAARRRRLQLAGAATALVVVVAAVVIALASSGGGGGSSPASSPALSGPLLATTAGEAGGQPVDGIQCQGAEQALFHIHAHLAVYVDGRQRTVPEGVGIPPPRTVQQTSEGPFVTGGPCFYWLHSHAQDGIVHVESPVRRTFTLGNYFDIWRQPLGTGRVGPARGPVTAFVDGRRFSGDPRSIPLTRHGVIQLDVGTPAPAPRPYTFPSGL